MKETAVQPYPLISRIFAPTGCSDGVKLRAALEGKTVLLTGASFGIGRALSQRLGEAGAKVLLLARSEAELVTARDEIRSSGGEAYAYVLDLSQPDEVDRVAQQILEEHGCVDVVVHNAGKSIRRSIYKCLDRAHDFQRTMDVNYLGPVRLQLALLPAMIAAGTGHIVNVSSVGVKLPAGARWAAYSASKSAFEIWLNCAVPELIHSGIKGSSVYLGLVHTRMSAPTEAYKNMPGQTPDQAACVVCRALIDKPRGIGPWWLTPVAWLSPMLSAPVEWLQTLAAKPKKLKS